MIFKKEITPLADGNKIYKLSEENKHDILKLRKRRIELDPGMGGVDPESLDALLQNKSEIVSLDIAITAKCNFKCIWCFRPENEWGSMTHSFSSIKNMIDDAKTLGVKYFIITGGEPLIYKDESKTYFDIIDYIQIVYQNNDISPRILTFSDVALTTKEMAKKMADRNISLCLKRDSLDSYIQDSILNVVGGHDNIVKGYDNLFEVGYGSDKNLSVTVNSVLAKNIPAQDGTFIDTTDGLIDLHMWIKENGMEHSIVPIHYCGEAKTENQNEGIGPLDIKVLYDIISAVDEIVFDDKWSVYSPFPQNKTCNRPGRGVHIRATGDVTSCSESPLIDDYIFGNIRKNNLVEIISTDKFKNFKKEFDQREGKFICNSKVCDLYANQLCRGGCATRSAYSRIDPITGLIENNTYEKAYLDGREDPLCPGWIILAQKQNALVDGIYETYVNNYLSKCFLTESLKNKIQKKIVANFYE